MFTNNCKLIDFKNHLSCGEINKAKGLLGGKLALFRNVARKPQVDLADPPRDDLGTLLIPEDIDQMDNVFALKSTPNGDCPFNAISILLCGSESLAISLHLLVDGEVYFNASFYADHEAFQETAASMLTFLKTSCFK